MKTGKVSNPNGGWDDVADNVLPPNPTNKQTSRELKGWSPSPKDQQQVFNSMRTPRNQGIKIRSRSVGRPIKKTNQVTDR